MIILELAPVSRIAESLSLVRGDICKVTIAEPEELSPCDIDIQSGRRLIRCKGIEEGSSARAEVFTASVCI